MPDFLDLVRSHDWPVAVNDFEYSDELAERYVNTTLYLSKKICIVRRNGRHT